MNHDWLAPPEASKSGTFLFYKRAGLQLRVRTKIFFFLLLNQNICCGYSKEPSHQDGSFEHPQHMLKLMGKKIFTILRSNILFITTYERAKIFWKYYEHSVFIR